jgi:pimeloyl-ACP methyl ester carboxylesterase
MNLHFQIVGEGPPLVILHGFLGSAENWRSMSRRLGGQFRVFAVDLRNHGRSPHSESMDYPSMVADLREFIEQQRLSSIMLLGHSMGGKAAMQFATGYSERVAKLVVVDIAPKAYGPAQRDLLDALRSLDLGRYRSFGEVDEALASSISEQALRQFLLKNLSRDESGRLRWRIHLEAIYRNYEQLTRAIAPEKRFDKPALFIRGGGSNYLADEDLPSIRKIFPQAEIALLPGAGHWVHVDVPDEFFRTVVNFLGRD